jgi:PHD/YefM family antitoxin component YafN of YafNO toxin-antitoxin module
MTPYKEAAMLDIHKKIIIDENKKPVAVQIPIEEFERLEELVENYGLAKLMDEVKDDERLSPEDAKGFYQSLR